MPAPLSNYRHSPFRPENKKPAGQGGLCQSKDGLALRHQLGRALGGGVGFLGGTSRGGLGAFAGFSRLRAFRGGNLGGLGAGRGAFFAFTRLQRGNRGESGNGQTEDEFFHTRMYYSFVNGLNQES